MADINSGPSNVPSKAGCVNFLNYLTKRFANCADGDSKRFQRQLWHNAKDFYKKDLIGHYGCVNAVEFSDDGNLLFSGGDDCRVLMWDVNNALMYYTGKKGDKAVPKVMDTCHASNIFCLAVDSDNKRVLSGGNDEQVTVHDYNTGNEVDCFSPNSSVFSLSIYPANGNIFAIAVDDGKILINDTRKSTSESLCMIDEWEPFYSVMFNPCEPCLMATANSKFGVHIWDLRKPREILLKCCREQSMSARWNQTGDLLLALRSLLPPIIYDPKNPNKILEFDSVGYYNACTMKSCSFAGDNDEYVLCGSDDFNVYMWKIPDPWPENHWVSDAHLTLTGHRSIVNQVRYEPNKQLIVSSGVEKVVKLWSPVRMPYSIGDRDVMCHKRPRMLNGFEKRQSPDPLNHDYSNENVDEDVKMIKFFDALIEHELRGDEKTQFSRIYNTTGDWYAVTALPKNTNEYKEYLERKRNSLWQTLTGKIGQNPEDYPDPAFVGVEREFIHILEFKPTGMNMSNMPPEFFEDDDDDDDDDDDRSTTDSESDYSSDDEATSFRPVGSNVRNRCYRNRRRTGDENNGGNSDDDESSSRLNEGEEAVDDDDSNQSVNVEEVVYDESSPRGNEEHVYDDYSPRLNGEGSVYDESSPRGNGEPVYDEFSPRLNGEGSVYDESSPRLNGEESVYGDESSPRLNGEEPVYDDECSPRLNGEGPVYEEMSPRLNEEEETDEPVDVRDEFDR